MGHRDEDAPTFSITSDGLVALNGKAKTSQQLMKDGDIEVTGSLSQQLDVKNFFELIEEPEYWFEIIRP